MLCSMWKYELLASLQIGGKEHLEVQGVMCICFVCVPQVWLVHHWATECALMKKESTESTYMCGLTAHMYTYTVCSSPDSEWNENRKGYYVLALFEPPSPTGIQIVCPVAYYGQNKTRFHLWHNWEENIAQPVYMDSAVCRNRRHCTELISW